MDEVAFCPLTIHYDVAQGTIFSTKLFSTHTNDNFKGRRNPYTALKMNVRWLHFSQRISSFGTRGQQSETQTNSVDHVLETISEWEGKTA